jgi:hypothetical protein
MMIMMGPTFPFHSLATRLGIAFRNARVAPPAHTSFLGPLIWARTQLRTAHLAKVLHLGQLGPRPVYLRVALLQHGADLLPPE